MPKIRKNKRKRAGPDIVTGIPLNADEVVHQVTVTRRKKRLVISSEFVCVPLPPTLQHADTTLPTAKRAAG